jgi:PAS domain S-box-containing protein
LNNQDTESRQISQLRSQAEKIAIEKAALSTNDLEVLTPEEIRQILHELRVHQIELEMQNSELRRTQAELDASRERYFNLFNLAPVGYVTVNEHGLILEANLTAGTLLGVSPIAMVHLPFFSFIFQEEQDSYYFHRKQLFKTGTPQSFELRMVKKDGTKFWVQVETTLVKNGEGTPICHMALSNIAERKRAEESLRENEENLRAILLTAMDGFWLADMQGRLLNVNETYCRMSGYSAQELLTMNISDLEITETPNEIAARIQKIMMQGEDRFESRHRRKDGSIIDVEVSVQHRRITGGRNVAFLRDITHRKQAEEALHRANAILQTAMDQSPAGIAIAEAPEGTLLYVNDAGMRIRGGTRETIVKKIAISQYVDTWQLLDLDGRPLKSDDVPLARAILFGETCNREFLIRHMDGNHRIVLANAAPIRDTKGHVIAAVVVFLDITERKRMKNALRLLSSRLLTSQEEEQRRIAMELHDQTGQDLNVLKLYLEALKSRLRKDQAALKAECDKILTYIDRIIEDVRRLAHGLSPSQLDALGLCAALKALIRTFSEKTRIPIRFNIDALDKAFPSQAEIVLYRLFQEALTNIYKHARAKTIQIDVGRQGDAISIAIRDDGQGFDPDLFGRGDPTRVERGMGLSAMEVRAHMIGAEFTISSQPNEGTEIKLLVPIHPKMADS